MTKKQQERERRNAYFKEVWGVLPDDTVAIAMGLTVDYCVRLAWELGIKRRDRIRTPNALAREMYVHPNTVLSWIHKGWLPAERSNVRSTNNLYSWHISDEALDAFLRVYPHYGLCLWLSERLGEPVAEAA